MGSLRLDLLFSEAELKVIHFTGNDCPAAAGRIGPPIDCGWLLLDGMITHTTATDTIFAWRNRNPAVQQIGWAQPMICVAAADASGVYPVWFSDITGTELMETTLFDDEWFLCAVSAGSMTQHNYIRVLEWSTIEKPKKK